MDLSDEKRRLIPLGISLRKEKKECHLHLSNGPLIGYLRGARSEALGVSL